MRSCSSHRDTLWLSAKEVASRANKRVVVAAMYSPLFVAMVTVPDVM